VVWSLVDTLVYIATEFLIWEVSINQAQMATTMCKICWLNAHNLSIPGMPENTGILNEDLPTLFCTPKKEHLLINMWKSAPFWVYVGNYLRFFNNSEICLSVFSFSRTETVAIPVFAPFCFRRLISPSQISLNPLRRVFIWSSRFWSDLLAKVLWALLKKVSAVSPCFFADLARRSAVPFLSKRLSWRKSSLTSWVLSLKVLIIKRKNFPIHVILISFQPLVGEVIEVYSFSVWPYQLVSSDDHLL